MNNLKENTEEHNIGQDGHLGGGGYKSAPTKDKKRNFTVIAVAIVLAAIALLILI